MVELFSVTFLQYSKLLVVAILIYAIIYSLLKKIDVFGAKPEVNSIIALGAAIIVSFSGVVTYAVSYAVNWFVIILFIVFLIMLVMMFLGLGAGDLSSIAQKNSKPLIIILIIIFGLIIVKSFFALNNTFDTNEPQINPYDVNTAYNTGVDDITNKQIDDGFLSSLWNSVDPGIFSVAMFFVILGVFVFIMGK